MLSTPGLYGPPLTEAERDELAGWVSVSTPGEMKTKEGREGDLTFEVYTIQASDTLQGICLRFDTSAQVLKKYNEFPGSNIKLLKVLKIPKSKDAPNLEFNSKYQRNIEIEKVMIMADISRKAAITYLEVKRLLVEDKSLILKLALFVYYNPINHPTSLHLTIIAVPSSVIHLITHVTNYR